MNERVEFESWLVIEVISEKNFADRCLNGRRLISQGLDTIESHQSPEFGKDFEQENLPHLVETKHRTGQGYMPKGKDPINLGRDYGLKINLVWKLFLLFCEAESEISDWPVGKYSISIISIEILLQDDQKYESGYLLDKPRKCVF
ncbi:hypothetical protein NPIL_469321 [Nephila pilipes]|uniref:Uncharacterized protein n=1 Tax=Nephila pilipes TaxID=299642 RepID=A0A8X6QB03_NEPPI|nr:hypothetical protein NPIL_469321 [Nephila pilipes]